MKWVIGSAILFLLVSGGIFLTVSQNRQLRALSTAQTPPVASPLTSPATITAQTLLAAINEQRIKNGLEGLTLNPQLNTSAQAKADDEANKNYYAHECSGCLGLVQLITSAGVKYDKAAENLAKDYSDTNSVVAAWMASPEHRANILNPAYTETGFGINGTLIVEHFVLPSH